MSEVYIMPNPQKKFGEWRIGELAPAFLSTDYKSPPQVIEIENENNE